MAIILYKKQILQKKGKCLSRFRLFSVILPQITIKDVQKQKSAMFT